MTNDLPLPKKIEIFHGPAYGYRTRMDFVFSLNGPGLRQKEKFDSVIPIRHCPIADPRLNKLLAEVWDFIDNNRSSLDIFPPGGPTGTIKYVVIRTPVYSKNSSISFIVSKNSEKLAEQERLLEQFAKQTTAQNVIIGYVHALKDASNSPECRVLKGDIHLAEIFNKKTIQFHTQSFFQNNSLVAEQMVEYTYQRLKKHQPKNKILIDLYGGAGTFGISCADIFKELIVIDNSQGNIEQAQENIRLNKLPNARAECSDATAIHAIDQNDLFFIVDPPRAGLHPKVLKKLMLLKPGVIIYVSCNPKQMVVELNTFKEAYEIRSLALFDQFPQTPHIETVVLLSKGEVDSKKIRVEFSLEDMDMSEFQDGATYTQIKDYVLEHSGLKVSNLYISQIKRKCGIEVGKNYNLPKSEDSRQPLCPPEKEKAIREAFKYFGII